MTVPSARCRLWGQPSGERVRWNKGSFRAPASGVGASCLRRVLDYPRPAMAERREILIEGYSADELLRVLEGENEALVFSGEPLVFRLGSANVLGQFAISDGTLVLELAHIDGGGEGILPALSVLSERYARKKGLRAIEWLVYAVHCAQPNLKLRRVLERKGFTLRTPPGKGECYFLRVDL